jgi:hypothetical protein
MLGIENPILWIIGVPAFGVLLFLLRGHFSDLMRASARKATSRNTCPTL